LALFAADLNVVTNEETANERAALTATGGTLGPSC